MYDMKSSVTITSYVIPTLFPHIVRFSNTTVFQAFKFNYFNVYLFPVILTEFSLVISSTCANLTTFI